MCLLHATVIIMEVVAFCVVGSLCRCGFLDVLVVGGVILTCLCRVVGGFILG
jgi:hypothetical protein